jgi:hypothetical protein
MWRKNQSIIRAYLSSQDGTVSRSNNRTTFTLPQQLHPADLKAHFLEAQIYISAQALVVIVFYFREKLFTLVYTLYTLYGQHTASTFITIASSVAQPSTHKRGGREREKKYGLSSCQISPVET